MACNITPEYVEITTAITHKRFCEFVMESRKRGISVESMFIMFSAIGYEYMKAQEKINKAAGAENEA